MKKNTIVILLFISTCPYQSHTVVPSFEAVEQTKNQSTNQEAAHLDGLIELFGQKAHAQSSPEKRPLIDRLPGWVIKFGSYLVLCYAQLKEKANNLYVATVGSNNNEKPSRRA